MAAVYYAWKGYNDGKAISLGAAEQAEAAVYGMHGYPTAAQAQANPNSVNSVEKTQVNAWVVAANDITGNPGADAKHAVTSAAKAATSSSGLSSALGFLTGLTSANLWIRVAKVIGGGVILIVGLVKLAGAEDKLGGVVKTAVKAAPLLA